MFRYVIRFLSKMFGVFFSGSSCAISPGTALKGTLQYLRSQRGVLSPGSCDILCCVGVLPT